MARKTLRQAGRRVDQVGSVRSNVVAGVPATRGEPLQPRIAQLIISRRLTTGWRLGIP